MSPAAGESGAVPGSLAGILGRYPNVIPERSLATAATLIPLRAGRREPEVLLIERADRADDVGSGQVALPGGRVDRSDSDLLVTALREFEEEVGLSRTDVVGRPVLVDIREARVFHLQVAVFAAALRPGVDVPFGHRSPEVKSTFWLPRSALASAEQVSRLTPAGPIVVEATVVDNHVLWGFTRRVLLDFFSATDDAAPMGKASSPDGPPSETAAPPS